MLPLRPYQMEGVRRFLETPAPHRYFLAWEMRAGKSAGALRAAYAVDAKRTLIVAPAMTRQNWGREVQKWLGQPAGVITMGRKRRNLSDARKAYIANSYRQPIQVVSWDLVTHVDQEGWDFIILDEVHNLREPKSKQSKQIRELLTVNPQAHALGLSGTLIPNEAKHLWNIIETLVPGFWGYKSTGKNVPFAFKRRYCYENHNGYGYSHWGLKEERREEIKQKLERISHRVVQSDFAEFLPPLFVEPLYLDGAVSGDGIAPLVFQWQESLSSEIAKWGIFTHFKETARDIRGFLELKSPGAQIIEITGDKTADQRDKLLEQARATERCIIVGTIHALNVGISLGFLKAALVTEWVTSMDEMLQFFGRFAGPESDNLAPTKVELLVQPADEVRMETLRMRLDIENDVYRNGRVGNLLKEALVPQELTPEKLNEMFHNMFFTTNLERLDWDGEDDNDF